MAAYMMPGSSAGKFQITGNSQASLCGGEMHLCGGDGGMADWEEGHEASCARTRGMRHTPCTLLFAHGKDAHIVK